MAVEASAWQEERVAGRVWIVRLDPYGRPSAGAVRLSCSRAACADQRFPGGAAAGRKAAIEHVNAHLPASAPVAGRAARRGALAARPSARGTPLTPWPDNVLGRDRWRARCGAAVRWS